MLLDQKRTKFWVRVFAIVASVGFVGALIPIVAIVIFQGGGRSLEQIRADQITKARADARAHPGNADAWANLAQALLTPRSTAGTVDPADAASAVDPARRAARLAPRQFDRVDLLVQALTTTGRTDQALTELQRFTAANPDDLDALLRLGDVAQAAGKTALARLSYVTVARRDPSGIQGQQAQAVLDRLNGTSGTSGTSTTSTTATPTTPTTPTTPRRTTTPTRTATTPTTTGPVTP